jgi:methylmalonyl-CoA mutase
MIAEAEMRLADGFAEADYDAWRDLVDKALKGSDFDRSLTTETDDGFRIQPLYRSEDRPDAMLSPGSGRGVTAGAWDIRQAVTGPDAASANTQMVEDLAEGGVSALLRFDACFRQGATPKTRPDLVAHRGAAIHTVADLEAAFKGIDLAKTPVTLDAGAGGLAAAKAFLALTNAPASGTVLGLDPIGAVASAGLPSASPDAWYDFAAGFDGLALNASSAAAFDAGASEAEELGYLLSSALAYLRALEPRGLSVADAAARISFTLAISQDQFMTIAKARAARALWAAVLEHAGAAEASAGMRLHGVTAERMFTTRDIHVNILRATIAGFSGAVGGLDGLTIYPFDVRLGKRDPLARRVARNLQIMLAEESHLGRVADPACGSYFVESLTNDLARQAWSEFQAIEQAGGAAAAIESGMLPERIAETVASRAVKIASRKAPILGISEFANVAEAPVEAFDCADMAASAAAADGAPLLDSPTAPGDGPMSIQPVGAAFEALRDAADAYVEQTGAVPGVFLANIGALAHFTARASFAANAFAAGGIAPAGETSVGYSDAGAVAEAFKQSGAAIACICGTDAAYDDNAAAFASALKAAGANQVWLAGRVGAAEAGLRQAGVDGFIAMGADVLAAMQSAHQAIGV